ncbi:SIS domain-containing protein [Candidatus Latescibacterota bacterium]
MSIQTAKNVLRTEAEAISTLIDRIGDEFEKAEQLIDGAKGRVIVSGLGKSGIIGRKISATFSSIGIPSFFLHPVEGSHGDIGMMMRGDVAVVVSKSGATEELTDIINHLKHLGIPIVAFTGNVSSNLASISDVVLDVSVECEACPFDIVPTTSTTAALALGDALAISLFERKGLSAEDFAMLHPGGSLGRKLSYKVEDLMISGEDLPVVDAGITMNEVIDVMTEKKLGIAVVAENGKLKGVITDGDLRRLFQREKQPLELSALEALERTGRENKPRTPPITIGRNAYAAKAVNYMEKNIVTSLVVTNDDGEPEGLIRLIDLSAAGVI